MNNHSLLGDVYRAFRHNLVPGLFLQALAISLCLAYYFWPAALPPFAFLAGLKAQYGIIYAILATGLFGGLIPYIYLYLTHQIEGNPVRELLFYCLFWAIKGAEVDLFYRMQGYFFGTDNHWQTIIIKTLVDQLSYGPLWMVPTISIAYLWKNSDFRWRECRRKMTREFFFRKIPTIAISNWLVWLPAVAVIYLMPPNLQVPLYNLVQCFFVLLLSILSKQLRAK